MFGSSNALFNASFVDYVVIFIYFVFVIGIGLYLRRQMKSGKDFFLSGRSIPTWITGLAFLSANMGALELLGFAANGVEYGAMAAHFYYIGAVPAMIFLGVFMMPFYYATKIRSVPEYLKLRYNEATRGLNAIAFGVMTVLVSGISLYSMGLIFKTLIGWSLTTSILFSAVIVLIYVGLGGLTSAIYNEVVQFFLIWLGLLPVAFLGLHEVGGWQGIVSKLDSGYVHLWASSGAAADNPMGITWLGMILGLGFVLAFGYWTTDFLVVQRSFAAKNLKSAQNTPVFASFFKMLLPFLVLIPGLVAAVLYPELGTDGGQSYNMALPLLIHRYIPTGLLGLALTALLASFMSGMAGNVTAFSTIFTYDIYQAYFKKNKPDHHYVTFGRIIVVIGVMASIGTAYIAGLFPSIMDYLQALFSLFNAPLFATFLLGMFWKRTTPWGGFWGLLVGIVSAFAMLLFILPNSVFASAQAGNIWRAFIAWAIAMIVTIGVSLFTEEKSTEKLRGVVYSLTEKTSYKGHKWYTRPGVLGLISLAVMVAINIVFW